HAERAPEGAQPELEGLAGRVDGGPVGRHAQQVRARHVLAAAVALLDRRQQKADGAARGDRRPPAVWAATGQAELRAQRREQRPAQRRAPRRRQPQRGGHLGAEAEEVDIEVEHAPPPDPRALRVAWSTVYRTLAGGGVGGRRAARPWSASRR